MGWDVHRRFWARSAGVPVDATRELASPEAVAAAAEVVRVARELGEAEAELRALCAQGGATPDLDRRRLARRLRRQIRPGRDLPADVDLGEGIDRDRFRQLVEARRRIGSELAAARVVCRDALGRARARERHALWRLVAEPTAHEAAALTSRAMADGFTRAVRHGAPLRSGPATLVERRALLFLQRLTAKPAMLAAFGPCFWGETDPDQDAALSVRIGERMIRERRVWFEHWAIHAVTRRIQADPDVTPFCVVRLNPGCLLEGNTLYYPVGHRLRLEPLEAEVLRWCTEGRTMAEIGRALAARDAGERGQLETLLANHLKSGVATHDIEVPTVDPHPERRLAAFLDALPAACAGKARWIDAVATLDALRVELARGVAGAERRGLEQRLDERFRELTGVAPTRNPGIIHGARFLTYEDCSRDVDVTIGGSFGRELAALEPLFDLASWVVGACAARFERKLLPIHARLARSLNSVDFVSFIRETQWINESPEATTAVFDELRAAWDDQLGDRPRDDAPLALEPEDFRRVVEALDRDADVGPVGPWLPAADCHALCVLAASQSAEAFAAGSYQLVLDKLYKGVPMMVHPAALPFCPAPDEVLAAFQAWTREPILQLVDTPGSYHRSNLNLPDVAALWECTTPGAASRCPPDRVIRCSEVEVVAEDGRLYIASHDGAVRVPFFMVRWPFLQRKVLDVPLHPEILDRDHTHRVTMGKWVLAREQWRFAARDLSRRWAQEDDPMIGITEWRAAHGLPAHVFVKTAGQPKSVAIDLRSALHADLLRRIVERDDELRVTEMYPGPGECWLADRDGAAYVSEFRFTALRAPRED